MGDLAGLLDGLLKTEDVYTNPFKEVNCVFQGKRLSMNQFRYVFNCTRIPGQDADSLYFTWKTSECTLLLPPCCGQAMVGMEWNVE